MLNVWCVWDVWRCLPIGTFPNVASMCCLCVMSVEVQKSVLVFYFTDDTKGAAVTGMEFCVTCLIDDEDNVTYNE